MERVKVGVIGVMTRDALSMTLASNVIGLQVTALADAIKTEATRLRADGAALVVVAAHAGGYCGAFDRPEDLGSCDDSSEIFDVVGENQRAAFGQIVCTANRLDGVHFVRFLVAGEPTEVQVDSGATGGPVTCADDYERLLAEPAAG